MITFLSSPKPFVGVAREQQHRAMQSWLAAAPGAEIFLYGESAGIDDAGARVGATVVRDVACAQSGVPFFGAIVEHARRSGKYDWQIYLNGDILLTGILFAFRQIQFPQFLLIGERIDLDEGGFVDVTAPNWKEKLDELHCQGRLRMHGPTGIDYFGFRRGLWDGLPPVVIGRGGYDNALLAHCLRQRIPIVDGTRVVTALHQFHDYGHVGGGEKTVFKGAEAHANSIAAGGKHSATLISDADYVLREGHLFYEPCRGDALRHIELQCRYRYPLLGVVGMAFRALWRLLAAVGLRRVRNYDLDMLLSL